MLKAMGCLIVAGAFVLNSAADAQPAIKLEPFPPTSWMPKSEASVTTVHNHYGRCGSAVVQVLGVLKQVDGFFTVDSGSAEGPSVVVIAAGGADSLTLKEVLSDYNGVACVSKGPAKYLLVWSKCGGSACGDDFDFTVVDIARLRVAAGGKVPCDDRCAASITGSDLPLAINGR